MDRDMTRQEFLGIAKERALQYCDAGNLVAAYNSMASDLSKHPETRNHGGLEVGIRLMLTGNLSTQKAMRKFIEDFD